ncbi:hypothetical protein BV372_09320 [Nostoc sp. T09]|uniref:hypothetical protein n=1 Tax=Nostoc sp. T09 TaxID=1932621 RepID=UPI000A375253|nr:hypothetical protein [Nostoc sp. T09]OUL35912.1 hypothetical protein BV372_09320 [Nostoc sp. T09]
MEINFGASSRFLTVVSIDTKQPRFVLKSQKIEVVDNLFNLPYLTSLISFLVLIESYCVMPNFTYEIVQMQAGEATDRLSEFAEIRIDAVEDGASVSFMLPFTNCEQVEKLKNIKK